MRILVACEESQAVTIELRKLGHETFSCDVMDCSGGHPEWHIKGDVSLLLKQKWDMIIAFPPCTYLSNAGACRLYPKKGVLNQERYEKGLEAKKFFMDILNADCKKIAVENPVSSSVYNMPKHTQEIQPWQFGHPYSKKTRLWLKGLPELNHTEVITEGVVSWVNAGSKDHNGNARKKLGEKHTAKSRSKTFPGIAKAMAEQWATNINQTKKEVTMTNVKTRGLFDWSTFAYMYWHLMKSINYKRFSDLEIEDFAKLMAENVYKIIKRFKIDEPIFCLDVPSGTGWRTPFFDDWYRNNTDYWKCRETPQKWFVRFDGMTYMVEFNTTTGVWRYDKMSDVKLKQDNIDLSDLDKFVYFENGLTPQWVLDIDDSIKHVYEHPDVIGLKGIIPTYKGNRAGKAWKFETSKEEFKEYAETLAYNLGHLFGARVVKVPWAEADDIIAVASTMDTGSETIIMTVDQDLHQLLSNGMFVKYYDIRKDIFVQKDDFKAQYELYLKILGGDGSDNINGVMIKGRKSKFPEVCYEEKEGQKVVKDGKGTAKWLETTMEKQKCKQEEKFMRLQKTLYDKQTKNSFYRNQILINLKGIPATLIESIKAALAEPPVSGTQCMDNYINFECKYQLKDYGVSEKDIMVLDNIAIKDRKQDLSNGYVEQKVGD